MNKYFVSFLFFLQTVSVSGFGITCTELEQIWRSKYTRDFSIKWDTNRFNCEGLNPLLALAFFDLHTTQYRPNSAGFKPDFYEFVRKNVKSLSLDNKCQPTTIAYTIGQDVSFCPRYFTDNREDRDSTLVHEARHTESDDPGHETCARGARAGAKGACDLKFFNGGWQGSGYNADIHYLRWTITSATNDALSKEVMQSTINYLIPDRFNQITAEETRIWRQ